MLLLAVLVIPALGLELASSAWLREAAAVLNVVIWVGFAAELVFVLTVSSHRGRTLRAHWLGALIVAVSFPLMPSVLQGSRALRLLRLVRLGAFGSRALVAARTVFRPAGFKYVAVLITLLVVIAGVAISSVEAATGSVGDGIWWAITTVTTVGYGDITPKTTFGRLIAVIVMLLGVSFFAVLTATISARFVAGEDESESQRLSLRLEEISDRLERIERTLLGAAAGLSGLSGDADPSAPLVDGREGRPLLPTPDAGPAGPA